MIIDPGKIDIVKNTGSIIHGVSNHDGGLLEKEETILVANGVKSYLEYIQNTWPKAPVGWNDSEGRGGGSFHTFLTYEEAMDTFLNNPSSLVVYNPTEIIPTEYNEAGNDVDFDVTGDFLDIGRFLEGIPESMGVMRNGRARDRRVRIVISTTHTSRTSKDDIVHQSERIIRLTDALETGKVRTEIIILNSGECSHEEIMIKKLDEPLSLEDVAVGTHPDFFRRMGFRVIEHSKTRRYGYGNAFNINSNVDEIRSALNDEITILILANPEGKSSVNQQFDDLEKLLQYELSLPQPENNLFVVGHGKAEGKGF